MRFLFPIRKAWSTEDACEVEMGFDGEIYDWAYPDILGIAVQCAVMRGFDLRDADLCGADLRGTGLTRLDLGGADLSGVIFDDLPSPFLGGG